MYELIGRGCIFDSFDGHRPGRYGLTVLGNLLESVDEFLQFFPNEELRHGQTDNVGLSQQQGITRIDSVDGETACVDDQ